MTLGGHGRRRACQHENRQHAQDRYRGSEPAHPADAPVRRSLGRQAANRCSRTGSSSRPTPSGESLGTGRTGSDSPTRKNGGQPNLERSVGGAGEGGLDRAAQHFRGREDRGPRVVRDGLGSFGGPLRELRGRAVVPAGGDQHGPRQRGQGRPSDCDDASHELLLAKVRAASPPLWRSRAPVCANGYSRNRDLFHLAGRGVSSDLHRGRSARAPIVRPAKGRRAWTTRESSRTGPARRYPRVRCNPCS